MGFSDSMFGVLAGKKTIRKTGEVVEVVASNNPEYGARSGEDWVSYIDSNGVEHIKEHLNVQFDFKDEDTWQDRMDKLLEEAKGIDPWLQRRYELAKEFLTDGLADIDGAVATADDLIAELKKEPKSDDDRECDYENIGVGEIVEAIDGTVHVRKFAFTDRKDIVGFRGDDGRWEVGDKVKVYIKKFTPKKGL